MKKWTFAALLLVGATILGATVLREPMANAASAVLNTNVVSPLDASGNVAVHEQGTAAVHEQGTAQVSVTNTSVPVHEQGTVATRSANSEVAVMDTLDEEGGIECSKNIYTVPDGKQLVIQYISSANAFAGFGPSGSSPTAEIASATGEGNLNLDLPFVFASQGSSVDTASEAVHYVVPAGTTLTFFADVSSPPCTFVVSLGGYLQ